MDPNVPGSVVLWSTPLLQAVALTFLVRIFVMFAGRIPVTHDEARYGRKESGVRHWADTVFWIASDFGLLLGAVWFCVEFGIELPSRY